MSLLGWYLFALALILLWILGEYAIYKSKYYAKLQKYNMSFYGPFLMWRTQKGKEWIERASKKKKFCEFYGNISLVILGLAMFSMTAVLMWVATLVIRIQDRHVLDPHMLLGLPGVNPIIPLWYGIFALVIAIIIHEFSHGIMTRLADIEVKSLGLTFWIIPMGAFMEPDEEAIMKTSKKNRTRMFAVGPASNLLLAGLCALLFSGLVMGAVTPAHDGIGITRVAETLEIENTNISFYSPAYNASLEPGMIIYSFNGTPINSVSDLSDELNLTRPGQEVQLGYYQDGGEYTVTVNLTNKAYYLWQIYGDDYLEDLLDSRDLENTPENVTKMQEWYVQKGYLGVGTNDISTAQFHPFAGADEQGGLTRSLIIYVTLPIQRMSPVAPPVTEFYEINGVLGALPESGFWLMSNALYWVFWLNLMVGLTNALPAVPLDGGYIFNDWLDSFVKKVKPALEEAKRAKFVDGTTWFMAFLVLFLILWQIVGPRII